VLGHIRAEFVTASKECCFSFSQGIGVAQISIFRSIVYLQCVCVSMCACARASAFMVAFSVFGVIQTGLWPIVPVTKVSDVVDICDGSDNFYTVTKIHAFSWIHRSFQRIQKPSTTDSQR
jgi:hypothetical protein